MITCPQWERIFEVYFSYEKAINACTLISIRGICGVVKKGQILIETFQPLTENDE